MNKSKPARKWILLILLVAGVTLLHYSLDQGQYYYHVFYGELYFLPIVLAAFWFGLQGALVISITDRQKVFDPFLRPKKRVPVLACR